MSEQCVRARRAAHAGRARAESLIAGEHPLRTPGSGLEFVGIREYALGDDFRRIDWRVSARVGLGLEKLFVREYSAEKRARLAYLVDLTGSMRFKGKFQTLAYVLALHARISEALRDEVALITLSDRVQAYGFSSPMAAVEHVLKRLCSDGVYGSLDLRDATIYIAGYLWGLPVAVYTDYANSIEGFSRIYSLSRASGGSVRFYVFTAPGEKGFHGVGWGLPLLEEETSALSLAHLDEFSVMVQRHILLLRSRLPPRFLVEVPVMDGTLELRRLITSYMELRRKA
ncbi:MAG: DUF58 domain-containing protein [Infirmifilum sp.]|uniref:DUF58 domain-containing protein n=1 Tax=Infirmifilum sp. TaxID=2856575 RepID=UPI003D0D4172